MLDIQNTIKTFFHLRRNLSHRQLWSHLRISDLRMYLQSINKNKKNVCSRLLGLAIFWFCAGFASDHACIEGIQTIQYMGGLK